MASKSKKKKKSIVKKDKKLSNEIRHLQTILDYTERNINGMSVDLDLLFTNQADRIRAKIDKAKENQ